MCPGDQTHVGFGDKCFYLLSHLTSAQVPILFLSNCVVQPSKLQQNHELGNGTSHEYLFTLGLNGSTYVSSNPLSISRVRNHR